jgi:phosphate-induced protein 1
MKAGRIIVLVVVAAVAGLDLTPMESMMSTSLVTRVAAQNQKSTGKMVYHDGPVLTGNQNVYVIWYGCWNNNCGLMGDTQTPQLMSDLMINIGNRPYLQINSTYPDASGAAPTGALIYGGDAQDFSYSHGVDLKKSDMSGIISDQVNNFLLPQDPNGIYVIVASADVASSETGFCAAALPQTHGLGIVNGNTVQYIFLGHPNRCPTVAGPQFFSNGNRLPTPNDNFAFDVLASNFASALNESLTNPRGNGWYDRYGLENADKCKNTFGQTYLTSNGARANVRFGARDYLIQQNWVNDRKPRCAMSR